MLATSVHDLIQVYPKSDPYRIDRASYLLFLLASGTKLPFILNEAPVYHDGALSGDIDWFRFRVQGPPSEDVYVVRNRETGEVFTLGRDIDTETRAITTYASEFGLVTPAKAWLVSQLTAKARTVTQQLQQHYAEPTIADIMVITTRRLWHISQGSDPVFNLENTAVAWGPTGRPLGIYFVTNDWCVANNQLFDHGHYLTSAGASGETHPTDKADCRRQVILRLLRTQVGAHQEVVTLAAMSAMEDMGFKRPQGLFF